MLTTEITATMTSREIAELTGKQHQHVKRDIESMLIELSEDVSSFGRIYFDSMNREQTEYALDRELTETLMTGYSAVLRRKVIARWRELESGAPAPANRFGNLPPEQQALISVMMDNADIKAVQAQQSAAIMAIGQRVDEAAQMQLLMERPTAAESIVHIRERINKLYGLPARIIDHVLRQSPYALKPFGMVKNQREEAQGGSYAVFWTKDVSAVFARFVRECVHVTATQATHPLVDGRFKLDREH